MKYFYENIFYFCFYLNLVSEIYMQNNSFFNRNVCNSLKEFDLNIKTQFEGLKKDSQRIIDFVMKGNGSGVTYKQLAKFVDRFGSRLSSTQNLEDSIDYMVDLLQKEGHDRVYTEKVEVPNWSVDKQWAKMVSRPNKSVQILAALNSVGTDGKVLKGDVIIIHNQNELKQKCGQINSKIVVYVQQSKSKDFKKLSLELSSKLDSAANCGAVAVLQPFTPLPIYTARIFTIIYNNSSRKIPAASITLEDTQLFQRLIADGEKVTLQFFIEVFSGENKISRNTFSEIYGQKNEKQIVLVSGHIDSVYAGMGAMDDGGGAFIAWRALSVIKQLGLKPKRTIRSVLWTGEEFGLIGAEQYVKLHREELKEVSIALESDHGTFSPLGLKVSTKNPLALCIINEVLELVKSLNSTRLTTGYTGEGTDVDTFIPLGVPVGVLDNQNYKYDYFYHSNGDTMTVENSKELDLCTAFWAVISYAFASIDQMIPR